MDKRCQYVSSLFLIYTVLVLSHTLKLKYWLCLVSVLVEPSAAFWDV